MRADGSELYQSAVMRGSQVVLVLIWYLPGRNKVNNKKFVMAAKIYMVASKIPRRALRGRTIKFVNSSR